MHKYGLNIRNNSMFKSGSGNESFCFLQVHLANLGIEAKLLFLRHLYRGFVRSRPHGRGRITLQRQIRYYDNKWRYLTRGASPELNLNRQYNPCCSSPFSGTKTTRYPVNHRRTSNLLSRNYGCRY